MLITLSWTVEEPPVSFVHDPAEVIRTRKEKTDLSKRRLQRKHSNRNLVCKGVEIGVCCIVISGPFYRVTSSIFRPLLNEQITTKEGADL